MKTASLARGIWLIQLLIALAIGAFGGVYLYTSWPDISSKATSVICR